MSDSSSQEITQLLLAWRGGDQAVLAQLMPLVHQELRRLARRFMHRPGHLAKAWRFREFSKEGDDGA